MIKCVICDYETRSSLINHIKKVHNLTKNEYITKYNSDVYSEEHKE